MNTVRETDISHHSVVYLKYYISIKFLILLFDPFPFNCIQGIYNTPSDSKTPVRITEEILWKYTKGRYQWRVQWRGYPEITCKSFLCLGLKFIPFFSNLIHF